ncbi:AAA family ATPase [Alteribacter natronophilus]|uniref:AAA family ATPase n=1 Tax=Alteribacter natronophilus TaxID=2583810 RepID=UPI0014860FE3|nr:AAA family ATPase [Alteribacter natronophilus]
MSTELASKEQIQERISVVTCGLDGTFLSQLRDYTEENLDFIRMDRDFSSLKELTAHLNTQHAEIAFVHISEFTSFEEEQQALSETALAKLMVVTDKLEPFRAAPELLEPFAELVYHRTPVRVVTERMLTFETKKNLRLYTQVHPESHKKGQKKTVLVYSAKGGVGKTTVAINLGLQLAKKDKKVLLVDFATFGNVAVSLNLPRSVRGMSEAVGLLDQPGRENEELERRLGEAVYTLSFQGKKLDVLAAASAMRMTSLNLEKTDDLLAAIQRLDYDTVVVDTSSDLSEKNISLMSGATDLLFVSTTDIAASSSLLSTIELVDTLNRPLQNRHLVINHYNDSLGFPISELESILSMEVSVVIPDKYEQIQGYTNRGVLLAEKPGLRLNRFYRRAANLIDPVFTDKELGIRKKLFSGKGKKRK